MDSNEQIYFSSLKLICDDVTKNPNKTNIVKLREVIEKLPKYFTQRFYEYIAFPLFVNLQSEKSTNTLKQELLDTFTALVKSIKVNKLKLFVQFGTTVIKQIFDIRNSSLIEGTDEELKLSAVICLKTLFNNASNDIVCDLYSSANTLYLSQCIYLCIQIAKSEKMRLLKLSAINCLMTICYIHDEADFSDVVLQKQVADCIYFFFPGITIALQNIALDDIKQGSKITSLAINALKKVIVLLMKDTNFVETEEIIFEFPKIEEQKCEEETKKIKTFDQIIKKFESGVSTKWYKSSIENLQKIIENLLPLQSYYHEAVRYELSDFCQDILTHCKRNLESSLPICLEILITLSEDENLNISKKCKNILDSFSNESINLSFMSVLEENFDNVIRKLPRIINGKDLQKQLSAINLLLGYLKLFGHEQLFRFFQSIERLNRFLQCLIFISTLETANVTLFEEYAIRDFESISETTTNWKQFKYIDENILLKKFQNALHLLSNSDATEILVNYLTEMFLNNVDHKNEIIFILNEILSVKIRNSENMKRLINNTMKLYLEEDHWYLSTDSTLIPLSEIHSNIIQMCLLVEGIGNMSSALGIDFKLHLLKTLYVVLERAGNAQPLLSAAGLQAILKISRNCSYESVTELIVQNRDYFSFQVIKRLKKLEFSITVLDVLNVVMKYSTSEVLPSIMNIVSEVLIYSSDKYQQQNILSFLRVFHAYVENLRRWININTLDEPKIIKLLKEYKHNMDVLYAMYYENIDSFENTIGKSAKELFDEDMAKSKEEIQNEYFPEEEEAVNEKKKELPEHITLTVAVLKRCLNFIPSKNRQEKLLTLNIFKNGIEIIRDYEDELLPLVHLIWSPLLNRFKEYDDPLIINKSFELLIVLGKLSKNFIRVRTSKDVLPELCKTLKQLSVKSYLKDKGSVYRYNQEYKLQLLLLNNIAQLVSHLEMVDSDIEAVMQATDPYLSCKQPLPLQESVINCYKELGCYEFDTVWLYLLEIFGNESKENEFRKNTEIVLKQLNIIHW